MSDRERENERTHPQVRGEAGFHGAGSLICGSIPGPWERDLSGRQMAGLEPQHQWLGHTHPVMPIGLPGHSGPEVTMPARGAGPPPGAGRDAHGSRTGFSHTAEGSPGQRVQTWTCAVHATAGRGNSCLTTCRTWNMCPHTNQLQLGSKFGNQEVRLFTLCSFLSLFELSGSLAIPLES